MNAPLLSPKPELTKDQVVDQVTALLVAAADAGFSFKEVHLMARDAFSQAVRRRLGKARQEGWCV